MDDPCPTTMTSFITDIATPPLCPHKSNQALFPAYGSPTCLTVITLFSSPLPHDLGALCAFPPPSMQMG